MGFKDAQWLNAEGKLDGLKAVLRKNVTAAQAKASKPIAMMLSIIINEVNNQGLPANQTELNVLDKIEEQIADLICDAFEAEFALTVTCDGTRDLFFYTSQAPSDEAFESKISELALSHDYDFVIQSDAGWEPYEILCPNPNDS